MTSPNNTNFGAAASGDVPRPLTILMVCADLTWSTRIRSTADALGISTRPVRSREMLGARLADTRIAAVILELEAGAICAEVLSMLRKDPAGAGIPVVAFAPHVNVQAMNDAIAQGANAVLARGAFAAQLPQILKTLVGGGKVASQVED